MLKLTVNYGHGTISKLGIITEDDVNELTLKNSLRPKYGDRLWNTLLQFRIDEHLILLNRLFQLNFVVPYLNL